MVQDLETLFYNLSRSNFRSHFKLTTKDKLYIKEKGLDVIKEHAYHFINNRLALANNPKDGKQTPMRGHPVFIAQHATATCCRSCLAKWHKITPDHNLTNIEINYIVNVLMEWIKRQLK